ncbi:hypothetical protein [Yoonia vestfoldensis]|uniref:hypothetical protein n=1 Tax=Yoonia vestfoldensis TaxID=245188 RepID=UPI00039E6394|nr:hypothetical protein [Yoonia vestfoldensis]
MDGMGFTVIDSRPITKVKAGVDACGTFCAAYRGDRGLALCMTPADKVLHDSPGPGSAASMLAPA